MKPGASSCCSAERLSEPCVYTLNPLLDPRWNVFVRSHPQGGVFHSREWMEALRLTYAYQPFVFTTCGPEEPLRNGTPFCYVRSWLTGRRLVSLPFSDHCDLLVDSTTEQSSLISAVQQSSTQFDCNYVEIRPCATDSPALPGGWRASASFGLHLLSLRPSLDELYSQLHPTCARNKIKRAVREHLAYQEGRSESILRAFYTLLQRTRRRHKVAPQPFEWFGNLSRCFGDSLKICMVSKDGAPIAAILTLCFKDTITYKYGGSDERFHSLGAMPFLFWKIIEHAKGIGITKLDLGKSDLAQEGLLKFKDHLGAERTRLTYWRWSPETAGTSQNSWIARVAIPAAKLLPNAVGTRCGTALYRHFG